MEQQKPSERIKKIVEETGVDNQIRHLANKKTMNKKYSYRGLTHNMPVSNWFLKLWRKVFCKKEIHLLDEVWNAEEHFLICDACEIMVHIKKIDLTYQIK